MKIKTDEIKSTDYRDIFNEIRNRYPDLSESYVAAAAAHIFETDTDWDCNRLFLNQSQVAYDYLVKNNEGVAALTPEEIQEQDLCFDLVEEDGKTKAVMYQAYIGIQDAGFDLQIAYNPDEKNKKYYVISREDNDSNADPLNEIVVIQDHPGTTNQSSEEKLSGWLGTTNDSAAYAHGEFDSLEDAQEYIAENIEFENFTLLDDYDLEPGEIEAYQDQREVWAVDDYLFNFAKDQISASTTDEEIKNLVAEIEEEIERENIYVDGDIEEYFQNFRDEIREQKNQNVAFDKMIDTNDLPESCVLTSEEISDMRKYVYQEWERGCWSGQDIIVRYADQTIGFVPGGCFIPKDSHPVEVLRNWEPVLRLETKSDYDFLEQEQNN